MALSTRGTKATEDADHAGAGDSAVSPALGAGWAPVGIGAWERVSSSSGQTGMEHG